jgi:hypothetical protein
MAKRNDVAKVARKVLLLKRQSEAQIQRRRSASSGDKVEVDYFALADLIDYFEETREAARNVIVARDALHHAFFRSADRFPRES